MAEKIKLVNKVFIRGSIEDVWREITKTDEVQKVMFNMRLHSDLEVGGPMRMRTGNGKYTGVVGEILEFDPPRRYSHTFRFTNYDDPPCRVTYELAEVEGGVEFTLTTDDLTAGTKTAKQMEGGAKMIAGNLKAIIETGSVPFGTRVLYGVFKVMEPFSPKRTLTTNWP